ncbi:MAG: hypothetical protein JSV49_10440 [Thermoplasmata archaeon]|nr:MAG: hypothetical protein JSV49_10440 [Thermoplasmata archaeon]
MTQTRQTIIGSNPFVDVAAFLFLEDIADKQGEAGMNNYLISLASSLAKSMPAEEYNTWEEFLDAIKRGESILTTFESTITPTDNCMVTTTCPFTKGLKEYTKRIGELAQVHFNVAEYYNHNVKPGALTTCCVICQSFRNFACERIKVEGKSVRYSQLSNVLFNGTHKVAPEEWLPILLEKSGISKTKLNMLQRSNDCIWMLYSED